MIQSFREYLAETEMLEKFIECENKLRAGLSKGAMLSAKQCHLVLMAFAHQQGTEKAFQELGKAPKTEKPTQSAGAGRKIDENRCSHRHNNTGTRCSLEQGHDGRHHYRCAGLGCPGYPWVASEMQHPPSCILGDSPYNANRDELSACSCGSLNVNMSFPSNSNLPADAGIDPTGDLQHAQCLDCGKKGPARQSVTEAILAWNRIVMDVVKIEPVSKEREGKGEV